jgi:hypothetical protein
MKRSAALCGVLLASVILLYAQDNKPTEMTGVICHSACLAKSAGHASCDATCTDTSSPVVFVEDNGNVTKINNPAICKGKMGQKVKVKCNMHKEDQSMDVLDVILSTAG